MIQPKRNNMLPGLLGRAAMSVAFCLSTAALAAALEGPRQTKPTSMTIGEETAAVQQVSGELTKCFNVALFQQQPCMDITPVNRQAREQQRTANADQPETRSPTSPTSPSDLPQTPDPEAEPHANLPGSPLPPSILPPPAQPGLPPPMPEPAAPHLAPPPPPMPQPADPPPLSHRPDLNPANPDAYGKHPTSPSPQLEPEPIEYKSL